MFIPDPNFSIRIQGQKNSGSRIRIRIEEFEYFDILPITDPGSRGQKGSGSRIPIHKLINENI